MQKFFSISGVINDSKLRVLENILSTQFAAFYSALY